MRSLKLRVWERFWLPWKALSLWNSRGQKKRNVLFKPKITLFQKTSYAPYFQVEKKRMLERWRDDEKNPEMRWRGHTKTFTLFSRDPNTSQTWALLSSSLRVIFAFFSFFSVWPDLFWNVNNILEVNENNSFKNTYSVRNQSFLSWKLSLYQVFTVRRLNVF